MRTSIVGTSLLILLGGCSSSQDLGSNVTTDAGQSTVDSGAGGDGGSGLGGDASTGTEDGEAPSEGGASEGGNPDGSVTQGPCTPNAYRCGPDDSVEVCNASGTSWLYESTCATGCTGGLCQGACTPAATRCNGDSSETCNSAGTAWGSSQSCASTFCGANGQCALDGLDVAIDTNLDGVVYVKGAVVVHPNATLTSPTGELTIYADSINVESGGTIVVAATGTSPKGKAADAICSLDTLYTPPVLDCGFDASGGGYGTAGVDTDYFPGSSWGSTNDSDAEPGSPGSNLTYQGSVVEKGGLGGGVLRLFASSIAMAGTIEANGANGVTYSDGPVGPGGETISAGTSGAGSGGGVLLAADSMSVTGTISAVGGTQDSYADGGQGRIKVLWGTSHTVTGTLNGVQTEGLLPPTLITSSTTPNQALTYNDNIPVFELSWARPFPSVQGYYALLDANPNVSLPGPSNSTFFTDDFISYPHGQLLQGAHSFTIVSVDPTSSVGTVAGIFSITINGTPPTVSSSSHPNSAAWSDNMSPSFQWSFPQGDSNVQGAYVVLDHDGLTVPDKTATFIPVSQQQTLFSNLASGVWVFHVVSMDQGGYLTNAAGHYSVYLGDFPGEGAIDGTIVDGNSQPVSGAAVTVNNGLYSGTTTSQGDYNLTNVPAGTWTVTASRTDGSTASTTVTVTSGSGSTANFTLP